MLSVYGLTSALAGHVSIGDMCDVISKHLRRLVPSSTCVFFVYDQREDDLKATYVFGEGSVAIAGLSIPLGQRLSGWVAANRQTICNSDAALDLEGLVGSSARLKTCISTPLTWGDELLGVVSLYGTELQSFSDDHCRAIEVVGRQISHAFRRAIDLDAFHRRDPLTGLPHTQQLEEMLRAIVASEPVDCPQAFLFVDIANLKWINSEYGRAASDEAVRHVVRLIRGGLRVADILFRNSGDSFVAFLSATDAATANAIAVRIRNLIAQNPPAINAGKPLMIEATVTAVASPHDGLGLNEVFALAQQRYAERGLLSAPNIH